MTVLQNLALVLQPVVGAFLYAAVGYFKNRQKNRDEQINWKKFGATMVVALGVGVAAFASGVEVSQQYVSMQMAAYSFFVPVVMDFLSGINHRFAK